MVLYMARCIWFSTFTIQVCCVGGTKYPPETIYNMYTLTMIHNGHLHSVAHILVYQIYTAVGVIEV